MDQSRVVSLRKTYVSRSTCYRKVSKRHYGPISFGYNRHFRTRVSVGQRSYQDGDRCQMSNLKGEVKPLKREISRE